MLEKKTENESPFVETDINFCWGLAPPRRRLGDDRRGDGCRVTRVTRVTRLSNQCAAHTAPRRAPLHHNRFPFAGALTMYVWVCEKAPGKTPTMDGWGGKSGSKREFSER